jgi:hypothetical protein
MNKNFVIVGTPRSGTTFVCDVLNEFDDIWIPGFHNYEPFNPHNLYGLTELIKNNAFDQDRIIKKFISAKSKKNVDYFGFKTFLSYHSDLKNLIKDNNLDVILILRKDIWKVIGSMLVAIDHNDYIGSSKKHDPFIFVESKREVRRIMTFFKQLCRVYWELENLFAKESNVIEKLYFEDIVNNNISNNLDTYFNKKIIFDHNYNNDDNISSYIGNFEELQSLIMEEVKKNHMHYSALPSYIVNQLAL